MKSIQLACIIDDDPIFIFGARKIIEISGFCKELLIYHNGQEALLGLEERIQEGKMMPELILLDLNMPIMNGWQFLEAWQRKVEPYEVPICILTSSIASEDVSRYRAFKNVIDYNSKPVTIKLLQHISDQLT